MSQTNCPSPRKQRRGQSGGSLVSDLSLESQSNTNNNEEYSAPSRIQQMRQIIKCTRSVARMIVRCGTVFLTLGCMYTLQPLVTLSIMMDRSQVPLSQSLYWLLKPIMFHFVFLFQGLMQVMLGLTIYVKGDLPKPGQTYLTLSNHLTFFDWLFLYALAFDGKEWAPKLKFFLKRDIKHHPLLGPYCSFLKFCFLDRKWEQDRENIAKYMRYCQLDSPSNIVLFPEGYLATKKKVAESQQFAVEKGLEPLKHSLYPRVKGLHLILSKLQTFTAKLDNKSTRICDCTFFYPNSPLLYISDLLFVKNFDIMINLETHDLEDLFPSRGASEEQLKEELYAMWQGKDRYLDKVKENPSQAEFRKIKINYMRLFAVTMMFLIVVSSIWYFMSRSYFTLIGYLILPLIMHKAMLMTRN